MRAYWFQAAVLLVSATLLILSLSHGIGRKMMVQDFGYQGNLEERVRELIQFDYLDAGPNVNAKSGYLLSPPPLPPPPPLQE